MKNKKRAYRRYKEHVVLKRRAKKWFSGFNWYIANGERHGWAEYWEHVKEGKVDNWMKDTGTPCSCSMCSASYERPTPEKERGIIEDALDDYSDDYGNKHLRI